MNRVVGHPIAGAHMLDYIVHGARLHEFKALRDDEVAVIEGIVRDAFEGFEDKPAA